MPFQKGNKLGKGAGRKGFEIEEKQLDKMKRLLDRDLAIAERLQNSKELDPTEEKKLLILQSRILKYADKLHATKESHEHSGEVSFNITKFRDDNNSKE